ncbi:hypothetical protein HanRHA438_Chr16g0753271 [Helianthus annuus]|nr:hypothetical protein HanIR_Chr16g0805921 [Helianthus annuus]KAJ0820680.1 hypothetical protein HanPSC8_Chr16g0710851 [Helianthus annuus]KAJ0835270.1 hypothetical protein HanRHA438_Chr16g0753271 [Helianthus annuus]
MDASVEYREEDVSSGEINEKENGDDVSLFVDFVQKSNRIQVTLDSESENTLIPETKETLHGQDPGADDLLNFGNNITDYDWVLRRNPVPPLEMDEHTTPTDHIFISNGQSNSPQSKPEHPPADCTPTTSVAPKLPTSFFNGVKSSNVAIRRPSPSRKAPSTTEKPLRSSTPTSRAAVTAATKPMAPIKRSTTPTPQPSILPAAKSASRSSTPTPQPPKIAIVKSASRSSTPTQRPSVVSASKSTPRSSTPIQRPSIVAVSKSASRSSTPTSRPSNPSVSSAMKSRGISPSVKSRPSKNPPEMPGRSAVKLPMTETNLKAVPKRTSCSPSRRVVSNGGGTNVVKSGITRGHGYPNDNGDDDVNPVLMGTKMVERVVNMRKLAPPREDDISNQNNTSGKLSISQENSGFGRSLSKKSFDMAMRHLDIRRSMPGNMRAMITKIPASSVYSVRPESTKTGIVNTLDSSLATSSSENGHSYHQ